MGTPGPSWPGPLGRCLRLHPPGSAVCPPGPAGAPAPSRHLSVPLPAPSASPPRLHPLPADGERPYLMRGVGWPGLPHAPPPDSGDRTPVTAGHSKSSEERGAGPLFVPPPPPPGSRAPAPRPASGRRGRGRARTWGSSAGLAGGAGAGPARLVSRESCSLGRRDSIRKGKGCGLTLASLPRVGPGLPGGRRQGPGVVHLRLGGGVPAANRSRAPSEASGVEAARTPRHSGP